MKKALNGIKDDDAKLSIGEFRAMMLDVFDLNHDGPIKKRKPKPMKTKYLEKPVGTWRIMKMEQWDEDYFNMEVKAYITICKSGTGDFQFGLVSGAMCGKFRETANGLIFDFTWEGNDECDEASGDGWFKSANGKIGEGEFRFHQGDNSLFWADKLRAKKG